MIAGLLQSMTYHKSYAIVYRESIPPAACPLVCLTRIKRERLDAAVSCLASAGAVLHRAR